jgi:hypothetical protein
VLRVRGRGLGRVLVLSSVFLPTALHLSVPACLPRFIFLCLLCRGLGLGFLRLFLVFLVCVVFVLCCLVLFLFCVVSCYDVLCYVVLSYLVLSCVVLQCLVLFGLVFS